MKQILSLSALFLLIFSNTNAQKTKETIEGNGKLVTRDVAVQSFNELKASGVYELRLSQGSKEAVRIEADENLHELFNVRNEGSKLVIDMKKLENKNLNVKNKMKVYVTFKQLNDLELSTVGNVVTDNQLSFQNIEVKNKSVGNVDLKLTANKLELENKSVGNITLSGRAQQAVLKSSGVGNVEAGDFIVQDMYIENTGVGNAEINAVKELKVKDSFLGKVKNKGNATTRKMNKVRV
jgi:hypothetical protein